MFECLSKLVETLPTDQDEFEMGWQYISLLEHTAESMQNKTKTRIYRCAVSILCLLTCYFVFYIILVGKLIESI